MAVLLTIAVAELLYLRALRILRGRGVDVPLGQKLLWHAGIALWTIGLVSPVDPLGDELLSAHMAQHLLIADLAAPLLLIGIRTPVLQFLLPRPVLIPLARARRLRRAFAVLRRPLVAIPVYVLLLYAWHLGFMFEGAVRSEVVHALQHQSFVAASILVWWSALEPGRRRLRGELWKIGHILGARMISMMVGMAFVLIRVPVYTGVYAEGERRFGLSALDDQRTAGALMISVDIALMVFALAFFFLRAAQQDDADAARA